MTSDISSDGDQGDTGDQGDVIDGALYLALLDLNRLFASESTMSQDQIFAAVVEILVERLGLALAWVGLLRDGDDWISVISSAGPAKTYPTDIRITVRDDLPEGHGPIGYALRTGKVHQIDIEDKKFSPWHRRALEYGLGGGIASPFTLPGGEKGIISLNRHTGKKFMPHIEELVVRIGEDLTMYLRHRQERNAIERLLRYQEAIGALLHRLLSAPTPVSAYSDVAQILVEKTDALGVWVFEPFGDHLEAVACKGKPGFPQMEDFIRFLKVPLTPNEGPLAGSTAVAAFRSREPIITIDKEGSALQVLKSAYPQLGSVQVTGAWPVVYKNEPISIVVLVSDDKFYFTPSLEILIGQLIDGIRLAVNNQETKLESARITQLHKALLSESDLLFTAQNEYQFFKETCERLIDSGLFKTVWIGCGNEQGGIERLASAGDTSGDQDLLPGIALSHPGYETASMATIRTGRTIYMCDYINDPRNAPWSEIAIRNGWGSLLSLPIERSDKTWGVLSVMSEEANGFSDEMTELLTQIAQLVTHGLSEIDLKRELNDERDRQSWLASHDILTGLPNRRGLEDRISEAISSSHNHETILAIGMLDLDDFKALNDRYGHEIGDVILRDLARRLSESLRQTDLLARIGGDEFVIVLEDVRKFSDLSNIVKKIEQVLNSPMQLPNGDFVTTGGSLGLSIYSGDESRPDVLLRQADQALYKLKVKKSTRACDWAFYAPSDPEGITIYPHVSLADRRSLSHNGVQALIHDNKIVVHYQPIVELSSKVVVGLDVKLHIRNVPGMGHGRSETLDDFALNDQKLLILESLKIILNDLNELGMAGHDLWCSLAVPSQLFVSETFILQVNDVLESSQVENTRITLELLQAGPFLLLEDSWRKLISLKELGVDLAIDDIGSAYSSLLRLRDLPIDKIKLDSEFVRSLGFQPNGFHFVNAMIDLSRALKIEFIAEGADSDELLDALITLEVPLIQGNSISKSLDVTQLLHWLEGFPSEEVVAHPNTSLGLYAFHIRQTFFHHQRIMSGLPTPTIEECQLQTYLERLGYGGSAMDVAHHKYHDALEMYDSSKSLRPNPYLRLVEESREELRNAIIAAISP